MGYKAYFMLSSPEHVTSQCIQWAKLTLLYVDLWKFNLSEKD